MFRKTVELPLQPEVISKSKIYEDLLTTSDDPLFSDAVKEIITGNDPSMSDHKSVVAFKSFETISRILQLKEDMSSQKKLLLEKLDTLNSLCEELNQSQVSVK